MGVPVKPMNDAFGRHRACAGEAVDQVVLAAVRFVGDDDDVPPVAQRGHLLALFRA
jgi:hypothetical protein